MASINFVQGQIWRFSLQLARFLPKGVYEDTCLLPGARSFVWAHLRVLTLRIESDVKNSLPKTLQLSRSPKKRSFPVSRTSSSKFPLHGLAFLSNSLNIGRKFLLYIYSLTISFSPTLNSYQSEYIYFRYILIKTTIQEVSIPNTFRSLRFISSLNLRNLSTASSGDIPLTIGPDASHSLRNLRTSSFSSYILHDRVWERGQNKSDSMKHREKGGGGRRGG